MSKSGIRHLMKELFYTHQFSVSLAHKYWLSDRTSQENRRLFGSSASPEGVGHNFDIKLTFHHSKSEEERQTTIRHVKEKWDHSSWLKIPPGQCSSLEVLVWQLISEIETLIEEVTVQESTHLRAVWSNKNPGSLGIVHSRPLSVLWWDGRGVKGGARLKFDFSFEREFSVQDQVLFPRSLLESDLESYFLQIEDPGIKLSRDVKENEKVLDALFNEIRAKIPFLVSIGCEMEMRKKWLIHSPILTR